MRNDETGEKPKGILSDIRDFLDERMPKGIGWANALGSSLLGLIVVQIVTGILLSFYYSPNADAAYESVQYIEQNVVFGSLVRGLHHFAASMMVCSTCSRPGSRNWPCTSTGLGAAAAGRLRSAASVWGH